MTAPVTTNVLLMSSYPILNRQWLETFLGFQGFEEVNPIIVRDGDDISPKEGMLNIIMVSLQDAKQEKDEDAGAWSKKKFATIQNIRFFAVVIDEIHLGVETDKTNAMLKLVKYDHLFGLSATPGRNLSYGRFSLDNCHIWDLVDEMKKKRSGDPAYQRYEQIHFIGMRLNENIRSTVSGYSADEGFTFKKFLSVDESGRFEYEAGVESAIRMLFGLGEFTKSKHSITKHGCKGVLITVEESKCVKALQAKLEKMVGKKYDVFWTTSAENDVETLYGKVHNNWVPGKTDGAKGTIVIVVDQLKTGVTLPWCDAVVVLNDGKSPSEWIQTAFRCQSPRSKMNPDGTPNDRFGAGVFVFDLDVNRVLMCQHRMTELRQATKGGTYAEVIREVIDCCPLYICEDGITFEEISAERFIELKNKMDYTGYADTMFGSTLMGMLINEDDVALIKSLNIDGSGVKTVKGGMDDGANTEFADKGKNENITIKGKGKGAKGKKS